MDNLDKIYSHEFTLQIGEEQPLDTEQEDCNELDYYINNTQFYFVHFLSLLSQLDNAVGLLNNFGYGQKNKISRGDHLTYNVENYMVRIISVTDRLLQLINMVFNLQVDESKVNYKRVIGHNRIKNSELEILYGELKQILNNYYNDRNSVVHRHSYINKELYRIQALYHPTLTERYIQRSSSEDIKKMKYVRSQALKRFTEKIKLQFCETNDACFAKILRMLDILQQEYNTTRQSL